MHARAVSRERAVAHAPREIVTPAVTIARCIRHALPRIVSFPFLFVLFLNAAGALTGLTDGGRSPEEGAGG